VSEAALGSLDKEFFREERTYPGSRSKERGCRLAIKVRMPRRDDDAIKRNVADCPPMMDARFVAREAASSRKRDEARYADAIARRC